VWRVLVVEDDQQTREFFADSVSHCDSLRLVASVGTVVEAIVWLDTHADSFDVLLTDLGLPDGSGLEVIVHAKALNPACEPLVISMFGDDSNVLASIEAGALGYIHKDSSPEDIAKTILDMCAGASPISPMIARRVLDKYRTGQSNRLSDPAKAASKANDELHEVAMHELLTPRERDVLALIARGFSYAEVARLQSISLGTVQTHIKSLYVKLSVHSKSEAIFEASRMGFLSR
jgi:DNA-binding NarL/FixJ family response regulator